MGTAMKIHIVFVTFLLLPPVVYSSTGDGEFLLESCSGALSPIKGETPKSKEAFQHGYCHGLLRGIRNAVIVYEDIIFSKIELNGLFCMPRDISGKQSIRVVVKYLNDHPEKLHEYDALLAMSALKEAFPCDP